MLRSLCKRWTRGRALLVVAVAAMWSGGAAAARADETAEARAHLERRHEEVRKLLEQRGAAAERRLSALLGELLDVRALSERVLGSVWSERSEAERRRFVEVLGKLVERSYRKGVRRTLGYRVRILGAERREDGVLVRTEARSKRDRRAPPIAIDYLMVRRGPGDWRIVDIVTDGVSLTRNYRRRFRRVLRKEGWRVLMEKLERQLAAGNEH